MDIASVLLKSADLLLKITTSPVAKEIQSIWKYESEIKRFAETVELIGDVLSDVEDKRFQEKSVERAYKRLRNMYLDAEDFLDAVEAHKKKLDADTRNLNKEKEEMMTKANGSKRKQLSAHAFIKKKVILMKTRRFFSQKIKHAFKMHKAMKEIMKNLDDIATDLKKIEVKGTTIRSEATNLPSIRATGPCVDADNIIGREEDMGKIVDLLLSSSASPKKIPVISIVGIGGMGKTTTAQLLYNDNSWQQRCSFDLKLWVPDCKKFNVESLLKNILKSINPSDTSLDSLAENHLRKRLVKEIGGKSFFLVLDDVENEDILIWENLESLLNHGNKGGSRILVTTRSRKVADVMGSSSPYELRGLSEPDALHLFERYAFRGGRNEHLVELGKLCVQKCLGVPLAIKVIGSLLCDVKDKRIWDRVWRETDLAIKDESNQIISILMISYYNLDSTLKQCFSYCALYPKNHRISKQILSCIWRANVRLQNENGLLEDECEKLMKTLCDRCLLQEVEEKQWDGSENRYYFKMHDLIHDLAKKVAGEELFVVNSNTKVNPNKLIFEENVRHVSLIREMKYGEYFSSFEVQGRRLRTFLQPENYFWLREEKYNVDELVLNCPVLRLLGIHSLGIKNLTNAIGKLIHLRYLDLSYNNFQTLPNSVVDLINLRHLSLAKCEALTHLPSGMGALTSLQVLDISGCVQLEGLPMGTEQLINLRHLNLANCTALSYSTSEIGALSALEMLDISQCVKSVEQLMGIENLTNLRILKLRYCRDLTHLLAGMDALTSLEVLDIYYGTKLEELPAGIEKLINLKHLNLHRCQKLKDLPISIGLLTSLKELDISYCYELKELPMSVVKLINLKHLRLKGCRALTYMPTGLSALKSLCTLDKFIVGDSESNHSAQFEELGHLSDSIQGQLEIKLPNNITLRESLDGEPEQLLLHMKRLRKLEIEWQDNPKEEVPSNHIDILAKLQPPPNLEEFCIEGYQGMAFPRWVAKEGFAYVLPKLKKLFIWNCEKLQHLPPLNRLLCLRELKLWDLRNLEYIEENVSTSSFCPLLDDLTLDNLPKLKYLWRGSATGADDEQSLLLSPFPCLFSLWIDSCPSLTVAPILLSSHQLFSVNRNAEKDLNMKREETKSSSIPPALSSSSSVNLFVQVCRNGGGFAYRDFEISWLSISNWDASSSQSVNMVEAFREMSKYLRKLYISNYSGLKTLPGLQHLTALRELSINKCPDFTGDEDGQVSWKDLHCLKYLAFSELPKMQRLPEGIQFLTSLEGLYISRCDNLLLPEWLNETVNSTTYEEGFYDFKRVMDRDNIRVPL